MLLAFLGLSLQFVYAGDGVIDSFATEQTLISVPDDGEVSSSVGDGSDTTIIGGSRDASVVAFSGGQTILEVVSADKLYFSTAAVSTGTGKLQWDGFDGSINLNPTGLGGIDLTAGGTNTYFEFYVEFVDQPYEAVFTVWSDATHWTSVNFTTSAQNNSPPVIREIDFALFTTPGLCGKPHTDPNINMVICSDNVGAPGGTQVADLESLGAMELVINPNGGTPSVDLILADITVPNALTSSLGDRVWHDLNADGQQNCSTPMGNKIGDGDDGCTEPGISGATVNLYGPGCTGDPIKIAFTDSEGFYQFTELDPTQQYCVEFDEVSVINLLDCSYGDAEISPEGEGGDGTQDSDANPLNGRTGNITLNAGQFDRAQDAGFYCPLSTGLGDFVWEDEDGDGVQGDNENGIPGVIVNLYEYVDGVCFTGDDVPFIVQTTTGQVAGKGLGYYEFLELASGSYCVQFDIVFLEKCPVGLGKPIFTDPNVGDNDSKDSDAIEDDDRNDDGTLALHTRTTGAIVLESGQIFDDTNDAGVYCPEELLGEIGDRVWNDTGTDPTNTKGVQDLDETDLTGLSGLTVKLLDCDGNVPGTDALETTTTDVNGLYLFDQLPAGDYAVQFTKPDGTEFTLSGQGSDDALDSDCDASGVTSCVTLGPGGINLSLDCGLVPPPPVECDLLLDKQCRVETPPVVANDEKCDGKLTEVTLIWNGEGPITVSGPDNDAAGGLVIPNQEVIFSGPFNDDVFITIADEQGNIGQSKFHTSCSDKDMDGWSETNEAQLQLEDKARDCGKDQGNAKDNDPAKGFINTWLLEGFVDNSGDVLDCATPGPDEPPTDSDGFADNCSTVAPLANCDTLGKPTTLVFEYTGGGCDASNNDQGSKANCSDGDTVSGPVDVRAGDKKDFRKKIYTVSPETVNPNVTFEISHDGSDLKSNTYIEITDENDNKELNQIHTSCSVPLNIGDIFGSLTLVGFNGQEGGAEVTYRYTLTNNGDLLNDVTVTDDKLGDIRALSSIGTGGTDSFDITATIAGTTTNTATATGTLGNGEWCIGTSNTVVVEVTESSALTTNLVSEPTKKAKKAKIHKDYKNLSKRKKPAKK